VHKKFLPRTKFSSFGQSHHLHESQLASHESKDILIGKRSLDTLWFAKSSVGDNMSTKAFGRQLKRALKQLGMGNVEVDGHRLIQKIVEAEDPGEWGTRGGSASPVKVYAQNKFCDFGGSRPFLPRSRGGVPFLGYGRSKVH
jgi:hypothetical protein